MNLQEFLKIDFTGKNILVIGKPGSGKTHISKCLHLKYGKYRCELISTDNYLKLYEDVGRQMYAIFEDAAFYQPHIIEGVMGYMLLLEGYKKNIYHPDIVIECQISAGKQREVYLAERNPEKLKYLRRFQKYNQHSLNEYLRICPKDKQAQFFELQNEF